MVIRTGLLCVPSLDGESLGGVRRVLHESVPGAIVVLESAVASQRNWVAETLRRWCDEEEMDLVLTIGGTLPAPGPSAGEIVPEATLEVVERLMPGLPETMRAEALAETPLALLDRGVAGIRSRTLILNLPEGTAAALFLQSVAEMIPAVVAHLQESPAAPRLADAFGADDTPSGDDEAAPVAPRKRLDPDEFAAWLRRADKP